MIYYFHAVAQVRANAGTEGDAPLRFCTPSGNFGNLTAGLIAKRSGLPIDSFVAATNVNDVVPAYLESGRFEPRPSVRTMTNAMDVGHPSNFERMSWLYHGDVDAMRHDIAGARYTDTDVCDTIRQVYETRGYLLDPHSAIGYLGARSVVSGLSRTSDLPSGVVSGFSRTSPIVFLATAHPAKFAEIVDPIIGRPVEKPAPLAQALAKPRHIIRIDATFDAVHSVLTEN
jgi:Threonine synthase